MSSTGIADNSVGGNVTNPANHISDPSKDAQDRANSDYGSSGPSAGFGNNVEKDFGERKQEGGVKGLMNKITDKMQPSHDQPVQKGPDVQTAASGHPTSQKQTDRDLNRE